MRTLNTILLTTALSLVNPAEINCQNAQNYYEVKLVPVTPSYKTNPSLNRLVEYFKERDFNIEGLLSNPKFEIYEDIDKSFKNSAEKIKNYEEYKRRLGLDAKKGKIKGFIKDYDTPLSAAEKKYGIEKELIASIIGVESDFGKNIGRYYPFNSFVSLFIKKYKEDFALQQLEELLKFSKKKNVDIFELKSSYAGAIGFGQFIPSSLNQFFVGDNVYDMNDCIQSIGNYLFCAKKNTKSTEKAVFAYNHSDWYVKAVLELAKAGK
jgi:membrane-bound lytic murein transglycosylase B